MQRSTATRELPARTVNLRAATYNEANRTVEAIVATENRVAVMDRAGSWTIIDEILLMSGAKTPGQVPLLAGHDRSPGAMVGSVRDFHTGVDQLTAWLHISSSSPNVSTLIREGHLTDVSVGYQVLDSVEIPAGQTRTVQGRSYTAGPRTLRVVTRWRVREVSIVAIGADSAATIRSQPNLEARTMPRILSEPADKLREAIHPMLQRSGGNVPIIKVVEAALAYRGLPVSEDASANWRTATSDGIINEAVFDSEVNAWVEDGAASEPDNLAGVYCEVPAENFLPMSVYTPSTMDRMELISSGSTASHVDFRLDSGGSIRIARFAKQTALDEMDIIDGQRFNVQQMAFRQLGAMNGRVQPDLSFSLILANPTMAYDNTPVFHADHGNLGTGAGSALSTTSLYAALAAIAGQVYQDTDGDPVHVNNGNRGYVLVVPPDLLGLALCLVADITLPDGVSITVRSESRLGTAGVVDPSDDETIRVGSATNWLLAARAPSVPSLIVSGLNGKLTPTVRRFALEAGQWGNGYDIKLDVGAAIVDHRGLYWADGA